MTTYQVESMYDVGEDIRAIGKENWESIKYSPLDEFEFKNNDDAYYLLEDENMLRVITARSDAGELVGFVLILVQPLTHHADNTVGAEIGFFVKPDSRNKKIGYKLIQEAESLCKEAGVDVLQFTVPCTFDYSAILQRQEFAEVERTFMKRIN